MEYNKEEYISPQWPGFRRAWWIVAIILFILLLLMWLMGYGPGGKACKVPAEVRTVEKLVAAPDVTAPLITLNDLSVLNLVRGEKYVEAGARAIDGTDGNMTVMTSGEVDTSKVGEYIVTYTVIDAAGNSTTETRKVTVTEPVDTAAPEIKLKGESIVYLKAGEKYIDAGADGTDLIDGKLSVESKGKVDTSKAGEYVISYRVTDEAGNHATATRKVVVIAPDNEAPIISLNDASVIYLKSDETYIEAGAKAVDANDGDLQITTEGAVDTNKAGEYIITYKVTDSAGNVATKTRRVIVTVADDIDPVISLNGSSVLYLERGESYTEAGAKAYDNNDGAVKVIASGFVDTNKVGSYLLSYTAVDKTGNRATATRKIIVSPRATTNLAEPTSPTVISESTKEVMPSTKLYFGLDKDDNPRDTDKSLATVIEYLKTNSKSRASISGFHDPSGHHAYNKDLANRRAKTVMMMLNTAGISAERIVIQKPVETTGTGSPKEARRVEVSIVK